MNNTGAPPPGRFNNEPRGRPDWTMELDDEDSGIELVTVNNYQQRNINQLVSSYKCNDLYFLHNY